MVTLSGEFRVSATGSVGYPTGHDWNIHWLKTTKYLARLREVYQSAPANNIDLIAIVDAFMIACTHETSQVQSACQRYLTGMGMPARRARHT